MFENRIVKGGEFAQSESDRHADEAHVSLGSGTRLCLYLGNRFIVVKDLKKELGLLAAMCKQLGIREEDL